MLTLSLLLLLFTEPPITAPGGVFMTRETFKLSLRSRAPPVYHIYLSTRPPLPPCPGLSTPAVAPLQGGGSEEGSTCQNMTQTHCQQSCVGDSYEANEHSVLHGVEGGGSGTERTPMWMVQTRGIKGLRRQK